MVRQPSISLRMLSRHRVKTLPQLHVLEMIYVSRRFKQVVQVSQVEGFTLIYESWHLPAETERK